MTDVIGIVTPYYYVFRRFCKKYDINHTEAFFIPNVGSSCGLYFDRLIFTCGYAKIHWDELDSIAMRTRNAADGIGYLSCCHLDKPDARI